ncbi:Serine/threonine-protein phosphatase PP1-1 [Tritrichomonas foetus]|uniref:Serine/threonine-protein phosphatase n=1 Tax=Tritrichomonas foetus TaxID=1144522 RepID=A0A1J4KI21_9EUKA|nr:Serine/threonine-protein phosphatase PP1-1 [Tritrichomonas foetus]|eukprot:OHT09302.1 Serine/threonine-protein phosphatase PP1-1 [Tritrichomonas foetus]
MEERIETKNINLCIIFIKVKNKSFESAMDRASKILSHLIENKNLRRGNWVKMNVEDLEWLCKEARTALENDEMLIELEAPLNVVGDVHGQFTDLMRFLELGGDPKDHKYLFLGDYVDRGDNSIEVITTLLCYKVLYPKSFYLLRGNHETKDISNLYGFQDECSARYPDARLWETFNDVFSYLPLAAIISSRIFAVHGGLSHSLKDINEIKKVKRPIDVPENGFIADLLWADPQPDIQGYNESERGTSYTFGQDIADDFLQKNDFDLICRAHQVVENGFDFPFFPNQSVVTVFSAPNYCDEFGNRGAMLKIDSTLLCSFDFVEPDEADQKVDEYRPATPANATGRITE